MHRTEMTMDGRPIYVPMQQARKWPATDPVATVRAEHIAAGLIAIRRDTIATARAVAQAKVRQLTLRQQAKRKGRPSWRRTCG